MQTVSELRLHFFNFRQVSITRQTSTSVALLFCQCTWQYAVYLQYRIWLQCILSPFSNLQSLKNFLCIYSLVMTPVFLPEDQKFSGCPILAPLVANSDN